MLKKHQQISKGFTTTSLHSRGFTLIELLVVIAIIGILAAVVLVALNPVEFLKKGRDSQRLSDIETLVTATKLYLATNTNPTLPTGPLCSPAGTATAAQRAVDGTGWLTFLINSGSTSNTLPALPVDPAGSATQRYVYAADASLNFEYSAVLESTANASKMADDGGDDAARYEKGTAVNLTTTTASCP